MKLSAIKLLTDENISPATVNFLREKGFDVLDVKEEKWFGKDDEAILNQSITGNRFILTHDADFGKLTINLGKDFFGIIYLRLRNPKTNNVNAVLERLFTQEVEVNPKTIIVVTEEKMRVRKVD